MAFTNRIRLPFKLHKPQFVEEADRYRKANGETKTLSVVIRKVYDAVTDEMPEKLHERLKIALAHDYVSVEGDRYVGVITQEGDYQIQWSDFLSRPIAQATFKANVTPYNATNSNCGTCEEYSQIIAEDDNVGTLDEDSTYVIDVLANDSICCNPVTLTVLTFDSTYLVSATVTVDNKIEIVTKPSLPDVNSITLVTYRAACDSGMYDEAAIIGNIDGTDPTPVCLAPLSPQLDSIDSDTSATFSWTAPSPAPACGYYWEVRTPFSVVLASGTAAGTSVQATGLPSNEDFLRFFVRSNCCSLDSNFAGPVIFSLPPPSDTDTCGQYSVANHSFTDFYGVTYIDCNGVQQNQLVPPAGDIIICALQTSPCNPVFIETQNSDFTVTCLGLC